MPAKKFDVESLLEMVKDIMVGGDALNVKLDAITAEKTDAVLDPVLAPIGADAYFEQTWDDNILNKSPAIFYGIEDVQSDDGGAGVVAKTYKVFCEVVMVKGITGDDARRIFRYSRALEELFAENFKPAVAAGTFKVEQVRPVSVKMELDSSEEIKIGGVLLSITLV